MAIIINHRFYERLIPNLEIKKIKIVVIGTFNPGTPDERFLNEEEKRKFMEIKESKKFKKLSEVKNFYDRPQNRLWKIFDIINNPTFYDSQAFAKKNINGLKFYKGFNREEVFKKQQDFCIKKSVFITDIVKSIKPHSFNMIYDNFPDTVIEKSATDFNTDEIISVIKKFQPKSVLINFNPKPTTLPNIHFEIQKSEATFPISLSLSFQHLVLPVIVIQNW